MTECLANYMVYTLNYVGDVPKDKQRKVPPAPVKPRREDYPDDIAYAAAMAKWASDTATYNDQWGDSPPSDPFNTPKPESYQNAAQYKDALEKWNKEENPDRPRPQLSDYPTPEAFDQALKKWEADQKKKAEYQQKLQDWQKNNAQKEPEQLFVERMNQVKNELFDLSPQKKRQVGTEYASQLDFHFDDEEGLLSMDPGTIETDRQKECKGLSGSTAKGKVPGVGPRCREGERGKADYHECHFAEMKECWGLYQDCLTYFTAVTRVTGKRDHVTVDALPAIRAYDKDTCKASYKECAKNAKKKCACEDCIYDACMANCKDTTTTTTTVDPTSPTDPTDPTIPGIKDVKTTSSYYIPIPIVYGRYVVGGNIIWLGDVVATQVTETVIEPVGSALNTTPAITTQYHAAFAVAVARGPTQGFLRIWLGETLLFSRLIDSNSTPTEIENSLLFSQNTGDKLFYDASKMRVSIFDGSEDQVPPAIMGEDAPGYRGLAFVLFENFNLSYVGGSMPELKIEVVSSHALSAPTKQITATASRFIVDRSAATLFGVFDSQIVRFDYDTMDYADEFYMIDDTDPNSVTLMPNGQLAAQLSGTQGIKEVSLYDPDAGEILSTSGVTDPAATSVFWGDPVIPSLASGNISLGYAGYYTSSDPYYDNVYSRLADGDFGVFLSASGYGTIALIDDNSRGMTIAGMGITPLGGTAFASCVVRRSVVGGYADKLYTFGVDSSTLYITERTLLDTSSGSYDAINVVGSYTTHNISANKWGGFSTSLEGAGVVMDVVRQQVIIFLRTSTMGTIIAYDCNTNSVVWTRDYAHVPTHVASDGMPSSSVTFINSNGALTTVDFVTGEITEMPSYGIFDGAVQQYFDTFSSALTYRTASAIKRVYVNRVTAPGERLDAVLSDICARVGIVASADITLHDVFVEGYILDGNTKPIDALQQLCKLYAIDAIERNGVLTFQFRSATAPVATLTVDDFIDFQWTEKDNFSMPVSYKLSYADINNFCQPIARTVKQSIIRAGALDDTTNVEYSAPVVFAHDSDAVNIAERLFATELIRHTEGSTVSSPACLAVEPGDRVTYIDSRAGITLTMRVTATSLVPGRHSVELSLEDDSSYLNDFTPVVTDVDLYAAAASPRPPYVHMHPRVMFFPPLSEYDRAKAGTGYAVFYVGVKKNSVKPWAASRVDYKLVDRDMFFNIGPAITDEVISGPVLTPPSITYTAFGKPDTLSTIVVRFDKPVVINDGGYDVETFIDKIDVNLLMVGEELIQFQRAVADVDGRTYTFSGLIRGRCGTEVYGYTHYAGEQAVLIREGTLSPVYVKLADAVAASPVCVKIPGWRSVAVTSRKRTYRWSAISYTPWAPSGLAAYDAGHGDVLLTWNRRSMYEGQMEDDGSDSIPLSPDLDTYNEYTATLETDAAYPYDDSFRVFIGNYSPGTDYKYIEGNIQDAIVNGGSGYTLTALVNEEKSYLKKTTLQTAGVNLASNVYIAIVKLGGPDLLVAGHPALLAIPAGTRLPPAPHQANIIVPSINQYAVLTPGMLATHHMTQYMVLKPIS